MVKKKEISGKADGATVFAYGFDKAGFDTPSKPIEVEGVGSIVFVSYNDNVRLDEADGLITPSGIFERFERKSSYIGDTYWNTSCDRDALLERERQVRNMIEACTTGCRCSGNTGYFSF